MELFIIKIDYKFFIGFIIINKLNKNKSVRQRPLRNIISGLSILKVVII